MPMLLIFTIKSLATGIMDLSRIIADIIKVIISDAGIMGAVAAIFLALYVFERYRNVKVQESSNKRLTTIQEKFDDNVVKVLEAINNSTEAMRRNTELMDKQSKSIEVLTYAVGYLPQLRSIEQNYADNKNDK